MGRPHRPTGPDAESLRTQARLGNTPGGRTPLPPEPRHQGILRPLECGHVALIPRAPNLGALRHLCPCAAHAWATTPRDRAPAGSPPATWGFPPFPCFAAERGGGGRKGGRRRGAPSPAPCRGDRSAVRGLEPGPPGREPPCRGGGSCASPRSRSRGSAAVGNTYAAGNDYTEPATTTPPRKMIVVCEPGFDPSMFACRY
jgi:hypothetical protein